MIKKRRVFIAINLPPEVKKDLSRYQGKWQDFPAKWTPRENLHVTLTFLGDLTDEEVGEVCMVTKEVAHSHAGFTLLLQRIAYGPDQKIPPKMIWAEGEKSKELALVKRDLEESLEEKIRFKKEVRAFSPHITLGKVLAWEWRAIEPEERPEIEEMIDLMVTVESLDVMESEMKKDGPVYTIIESCQLQS